MNKYEYRGLGYEQLSREAERLVLNGGGWFKNFERLSAIYREMVLASSLGNQRGYSVTAQSENRNISLS